MKDRTENHHKFKPRIYGTPENEAMEHAELLSPYTISKLKISQRARLLEIALGGGINIPIQQYDDIVKVILEQLNKN